MRGEEPAEDTEGEEEEGGRGKGRGTVEGGNGALWIAASRKSFKLCWERRAISGL